MSPQLDSSSELSVGCFLRFRRFNNGEFNICRIGDELCVRLPFLLMAGEAGELCGKRLVFGDDGGVVYLESSRSRRRLIMFSSVVSACVCSDTLAFGSAATNCKSTVELLWALSSLRRLRASDNCLKYMKPLSNLRARSGDDRFADGSLPPKRCFRENNGLSA